MRFVAEPGRGHRHHLASPRSRPATRTRSRCAATTAASGPGARTPASSGNGGFGGEPHDRHRGGSALAAIRRWPSPVCRTGLPGARTAAGSWPRQPDQQRPAGRGRWLAQRRRRRAAGTPCRRSSAATASLRSTGNKRRACSATARPPRAPLTGTVNVVALGVAVRVMAAFVRGRAARADGKLSSGRQHRHSLATPRRRARA